MTEGGGAAEVVLAQEHAGACRPLAYLLKTLDLVAQGLPAYLRAMAAAALLQQTTGKFVLSQTLILHSSQQVTAILNYIRMQHLSAQQRPGYEVILCATQNLTIKSTSVSNTPTVVLHCLINSVEQVTENTHNCLAPKFTFPRLYVPSERFCV